MAHLSRLTISNVRNIRDAELSGLSQFNLLCGANGAGKTSVLEAISFLGLGRSFRSRKAKMVINTQANELTVFGLSVDARGVEHKLGVRRSDDNLDIKFDGAPLKSASNLARRLPLLVFNAEIFELIEGGPSRRREFFDWLLFHVEQSSFYNPWLAYHRALKQRNELLKRGNISEDLLDPWDAALIEHGEVFARLRVDTMARFQALLNDSGLSFDAGELELSLQQGWREGLSLSEALIAARAKDLRYKTTTAGPHRMEVAVTIGGLPAREILSRGQIKMLASQLKLAGAKMVSESELSTKVLVLLDDLAAETDLQHRKKLLNDIAVNGYQCFVTGVFVDDITNIMPDGIKRSVFHVEHGSVTKSSNYG